MTPSIISSTRVDLPFPTPLFLPHTTCAPAETATVRCDHSGENSGRLTPRDDEAADGTAECTKTPNCNLAIPFSR
jgi:hypothetical protein